MKTSLRVCWVMVGIGSLLASCSDLVDPDSANPDNEIILLIDTNTQDGQKLMHKGYRFELKARLPESASEVDVTFTTTGGTFVETNSKTIKQQATIIEGAFRYATATVESDTLPANTEKKEVYFTAEALTKRDRLMIYFVK